MPCHQEIVVRKALGDDVMFLESLKRAVSEKRLSADAIRDIAYLIESQQGTRSDAMASLIGRQLQRGDISQKDAEYVSTMTTHLMFSTLDEINEVK